MIQPRTIGGPSGGNLYDERDDKKSLEMELESAKKAKDVALVIKLSNDKYKKRRPL